ncbi:MAG: DUF2071 domain-containing protein [Acidimicrobiales bacterium]
MYPASRYHATIYSCCPCYHRGASAEDRGMTVMRLPTMQGVVERRLLINYRLDRDVAAAMIPAPFKPQLVNGWAVAGICLIRLGQLRPRGVPARLGLTSENAAHRFAVQWHDTSGLRTGVYVPTRHSGALMNVAVGDRLFPGRHQRAEFTSVESADAIAVAFTARDSQCFVDAAVGMRDELPDSELFASTTEASNFFRNGAAGFSPTRHSDRLDGLELRTTTWRIQATQARHVRSSFFDDPVTFPPGSIHLDSALVMRDVAVEWHSLASLSPDPGHLCPTPA